MCRFYIILFLLGLCSSCCKEGQQKNEALKAESLIFTNQALTCYFFFMADCPASRNNIPKMVKLKNRYETYGLKVIGVVADPAIDTVKLAATLSEFEVNFEIVMDDSLKFAHSHGATVVPQSFLYNKANELVYSGLLDDYYFKFGRHKAIVKNKYLENAIVSTLQNKSIKIKKTNPIGCTINYRYFE